MRHSLFPSLSVAAFPAQSEERPFSNIESSGEEGRSTHGNKRKEKEDEEEEVTSPQRPKRVRSFRTMDGFEIEIEGSETREVSSKQQPEGIKNSNLFGRFSITPFLGKTFLYLMRAHFFFCWYCDDFFPFLPPFPLL
jgi:hypothetical protein